MAARKDNTLRQPSAPRLAQLFAWMSRWLAHPGVQAAVLFGLAAVMFSLSVLPRLTCDVWLNASVFTEHNLCWSDQAEVFVLRGVADGIPPYTDLTGMYPGLSSTSWPQVFEYSAGLAYPVYGIGLLAGSFSQFITWSSATLLVALMATMWMLWRMLERRNLSRWRLLLLAGSPTLLAVGAQNWDLWAVTLVVAAMAAMDRHRLMTAAVMLGLGAAVKWYPAVLVPLLVMAVARHNNLKLWSWQPWKHALVAAATWAAVQLPAWILEPAGWWSAQVWQLGRQIQFETIWSGPMVLTNFTGVGQPWVATVYPTVVQVVLPLLLLGVLSFIWRKYWTGELSFEQAAAASVLAFVSLSKVYTAQFWLWVIPMVVLIEVSWRRVMLVDVLTAVSFIGLRQWGTLRTFETGVPTYLVLSVRHVATWIVLWAVLFPARRWWAKQVDGRADVTAAT